MKLFQKICRFVVIPMGLATAVAAAAMDNQAVLAQLAKGETITAQDLSDYLDRRVDLRPARRNEWGVQSILREMALTRILVLEGDAMGIPRVDGRANLRFDDVYGQAIYKKMASVCAPPADAAAARKYFDEHPQAFRVPPMARLTRVMLPVASKVDGETAIVWLQTQAHAISTGTQKLDDVVKRAEAVHKLDPQGDLGWVTLTDDEKILRALESAKQGELVGPVREGDFDYLFYVAAKRESRQLSWDEVAASVPTRAVRVCRQEANKKLQDTLFKKYNVTIDQNAIHQLFSEDRLRPAQASSKQ